jgi:DNA-binding MarR family transcriptional regulator
MNATADTVCEDLFQLIERFKYSIGELADERGLTRAQLFALYAINKHGELAMGQAANVLHCDASNVTGLVDRLVLQGLAERKESSHDRRTKNLSLTAKGAQVISEIRKALPEHLGWDILTDSECQTMHDAITKILTQSNK